MYRYVFLWIAGLVCWSCSATFRPTSVKWSTYPISALQDKDSAILSYLRPLRDSLDQTMNVVLGTCVKRMDIRRPVSTLGNFMSEACLEVAREKFDAGADISLVRFGGIRRPYLDPGPVTRGMVFELMPFDNLLVLVDVNGETLKRFIEELGAEGAGIAGFSFRIKDKNVSEILIGGKPIDPKETYTVVYSDYNYNNSPELKEGRLRMTGYLIRDAIEEWVKKNTVSGKPLGEGLENRIHVGK